MRSILVLLASVLLWNPLHAKDYKVGERLPATAAQPAQAEIGWDDLMPPDWDPMQAVKGLNLATLDDADPRAIQALERLRASWDNAPTNPAMHGRRIRIPGFVVPLDWANKEVREFLLVPYFGACIHVPPPPSNQVIHVQPARALKGITAMDAVWVSGVLEIAYNKTGMGDAGYRLRNAQVEAYREKRR